MNILSIQSHVAYGHVGNSAAVFPLQRLGIEVWPVNTVQFSNHPGYGGWRGDVFSGAAVRLVIEGIDERGVLGECDGVISGYLGSLDTGEAVVDAVARVKGANPAARYCCDPVIGDADRGVFVRAGIPEFIKESMLPIADLLTPNQFELDYLGGRTTATMADLVVAIDAVHARGPGVLRIIWGRAPPPRRWRWRHPRCSACSTAPPKPAPASCCWSRRSRNWWRRASCSRRAGSRA
jgi:pyridoxine kinase